MPESDRWEAKKDFVKSASEWGERRNKLYTHLDNHLVYPGVLISGNQHPATSLSQR